MLVWFSVENSRSFRDRVTRDLRTPDGAAPGKSNLVRAISMMLIAQAPH